MTTKNDIQHPTSTPSKAGAPDPYCPPRVGNNPAQEPYFPKAAPGGTPGGGGAKPTQPKVGAPAVPKSPGYGPRSPAAIPKSPGYGPRAPGKTPAGEK